MPPETDLPPAVPASEAGTTPEPESQPRGATEAPREPTRAASAYRGVMAFALVLVLLLVFILENLRTVRVEYFGAGFNVPLGVALLIAAVAGGLLFGLIGGARILQLRRRAHRAR